MIAEVASVTEKDSFFRAVVRSGFYDHPGFVGFWTSLIREHLQANDIAGATLVFSAHSIPEYHIANGDIYASAIEKSAEFIADELGLRYKVVYQSGMRSGKWLGPEVKGYLTRMKEEGADNLVLIPISFVHENLETLYDLDQDIVPFAINSLGFKHVSRVSLPESDPLLVGMLAEMATRQDGLEMYV